MAVEEASSIPAPPGAPNSIAYAARVVLLATLIIAPQLLGGVFPWAVAIIGLMAAVTGLLTGLGIHIPSIYRRSVRWLDWLVVAALGWTAVQAIPLPSGFVALFVPESVAAWNAASALLGEPAPGWLPLSLDPGATRIEVAKGAAIVTMYLTARVLAASGRRRWVLAGVGASGAAMALVAFGHHAAGATQVFGMYEPVYASSRLLAPLMNENHLGGFMAMTTPILLGLALDASRSESRVAWGALAAVCATAGVLSFSRGAILALGLGIAIFLTVLAWRMRRRGQPLLANRIAPLIGIGVLATASVIGIAAGDGLRREFSYTHNRTVKLEAAFEAMPLVAEHWLTGVGRGAFSAGFVGEHGSAKRFFYPENLIVQWTSEWGVVFSLLLLGGIAIAIARAFRRERSAAHLGALAGISAIAVHQMVDFNLEMAGVAVVAAATLGAVVDSVGRRVGVPLRGALAGAVIAALIGTAVAAAMHARDVFTMERELNRALTARDYAEARRWVETGLALHPAEPIFVLAGADVAVREGDENLVRWINHAQAIAPTWSAPHLLAARWLFAVGRVDQALLELRAGETKHPGSMVESVCTLLEERPDIDLVLRVAPDGEAGGLFLDRVAGCVPWTTPLAASIDDAARGRDPTLERPALRQAKRRILEGDPEEAIRVLVAFDDPEPAMRSALAEAYLQSGRVDDAAETVAPLIQQRRPPPDVLKMAIAIQVARGRASEVESLASRLRAQTGGLREPLAEIDLYIGKLYEDAKRYPLALVAYRRANRVLESRRSLEAVARLSALSGDTPGATMVYRRLCRADGGTGEACRTAEKLSADGAP